MPALARRPNPPSAKDAAAARTSGAVLSGITRTDRPLTLRVADAGAGEDRSIELPPGAVSALMEILKSMASGHGVTVLPENAEVATFQAADILNVSRPYLIKLLDEGRIPFRKVGKHRRIRVEDILGFKARIDQDRQAVLDELAAQAQEQGMGYPRR
ncbi:MAG: excisionase family DNA-binding protein [Beijerinckiaceae bacterium]